MASSRLAIATFVAFLFASTLVATEVTFKKVNLGIAGTWKIGYPTEVQVEAFSSGDLRDICFEVETVDAHGVAVRYRKQADLSGGSSSTVSLIAKHGRRDRPIHVRAFDAKEKLLFEHTLSNEERGFVLPAKQTWIVGIGNSLKLDAAALTSAQGLLPSYSTTEVSRLAFLPTTSAAYEGVDLIVLSTRDAQRLTSVSERQHAALVEFVELGGKLLVWVGENGSTVATLPWLQQLVGEKFEQVTTSLDSAPIESFVSSNKRLGILKCSQFDVQKSIVELSLISNQRKKIPVFFRSYLGFGQVYVFAADVDAAPLIDWTDRALLLSRFLNNIVDLNEATVQSQEFSSALQSYDDLSGQLYVMLEQFSRVRVGTLSIVAAVLLLFTLAIGPLDYFLVAKRWKKPSWTWLTLLIWSLLAISGVTALGHAWKPESKILNAVEVLDINVESGDQKGWSVAHLYSGTSDRCDLQGQATRSTLQSTKVARTTTTAEIVPIRMDWNGYTGLGLGGFDSKIKTDFGFPAYFQEAIDRTKDATGSLENSSLTPTKLMGVGFATAGTKSIEATWRVPGDQSLSDYSFQLAERSRFLVGSWKNPLSVDLLDAVLVYREWMYRLPTRLRPGAVAQITPQDIPKDLVRYLQRRQMSSESDRPIPWDPANRRERFRLIELASLYAPAGGRNYMQLSHRYLRHLDWSDQLGFDRIVILGQIATPLVEWQASSGESVASLESDARTTIVRFLLPAVNSK